MTVDRDHRADIRSADEVTEAGDVRGQSGQAGASAQYRYASVEESARLLDDIMNERAEVFRKLAQ